MDAPPVRYARTADGLGIAHRVIGEGPSVVVCVPPTASHLRAEWESAAFRGQYEALARRFRVIRFDHRGTGLSDHAAPSYSMDAFAEDIGCVLDAVGAESAVLTGQLQGVGPCLTFALAHPERVSHLVLWSPIVRGADYLALPGTRMTHELRAFDPRKGAEAAIALWLGLARANEFADAVTALSVAAASLDDGVREMAYDYDLSQLLAGLAVPTLVLHPAESRLVPEASAREVASAIPNAELVIVAGESPFPWTGSEEYASHVTRFVTGDAPRAAPGVTHTVLFTDLVASTATTQRLGDAAAQDLVRAQNEIVRRALTQHGGHEIKHTGDGIFASFLAASNALDCARAIQRAVADLANPDLGVKIGVNAGEPIVEEDDLYGTAVQIAARVTDQAHAGEVVCTNVVRELVAGKGYRFNEREPAVLKGVEEPVRLFTLRASD